MRVVVEVYEDRSTKPYFEEDEIDDDEMRECILSVFSAPTEHGARSGCATALIPLSFTPWPEPGRDDGKGAHGGR
jgi:hypothetical protein